MSLRTIRRSPTALAWPTGLGAAAPMGHPGAGCISAKRSQNHATPSTAGQANPLSPSRQPPASPSDDSTVMSRTAGAITGSPARAACNRSKVCSACNICRLT